MCMHAGRPRQDDAQFTESGASSGESPPTGLTDVRAAFEQALERHFANLPQVERQGMGRLLEAVRYSTLDGGKRLRAILVLETCRVAGGEVSAAMPAAIAIECIHAFSLVHDDLPAMDDDQLRRGRLTTHRAFGEAEAILAGDWLLAHAFGVVAAGPLPEPVRLSVLSALSDAACAMIAGQSADIAGEQSPPDSVWVEYIHRNKTAALIEAACRLGGLCAAATSERLRALTEYGRRLGLAFQIVDDLLDACGESRKLQKNASRDAARRKQTAPAVWGIPASRDAANRELACALQALEFFGANAEGLRDLARYVVLRGLTGIAEKGQSG